MTAVMASGELVKLATQKGLTESEINPIVEALAPLAQQADELIRDAQAIVVERADQTREIAESYKQRQAIKKVRVAAEKAKEGLKRKALDYGDAVQAVYNFIKGRCEAEEARLLAGEEFAERQEKARKKALADERAALLAPLGVDPAMYQLGEMSAEAFGLALDGARLAKDKRDAEAKAAAEAEAKRKAEEAAERERLRVENERLQREKEAAEAAARAERERAEAERRAAEAQAKAEREAIEAKARAEREAAAEVARKEREEAEKKLAAERAERERLEREARERAEAEAKAKAEQERVARVAAAAPDAEKLRAFVETLCSFRVPEMSTEAGKIARAEVLKRFDAFQRAVLEMADALAS